MEEITVEFLGSAPVSGRVIASEPAADVSIIQLERVPPGARVAPVADSSKVAIGDRVIVVGAPYGLSYSLSAGLISARYAPNTVYQAFPLAEFFQTDAAINTGNSGGPMFNMAGQVIGVVSHIISKSGGSEGLGFVVTINSARENLLQRRAFWSGLEVYPVTGPLADVLNLPPKAEGLMVKSVAKGSRAEEVASGPGQCQPRSTVGRWSLAAISSSRSARSSPVGPTPISRSGPTSTACRPLLRSRSLLRGGSVRDRQLPRQVDFW
jgi:S1-C subfamily serine protease